jgi:endonuclease YncB( thermonuclease family)
VKVYDGDTITIACKYPKRSKNLYRFPVRLAGIDAPEMNAVSLVERIEANHSKYRLHNLIFNETVRLENIRIEKYGRLLADVYLYDIHVNSWLLENNCAIPYNGGTKIKN